MTGSEQWSKELTGRFLFRVGHQHMAQKVPVSEKGSRERGDFGFSWFSQPRSNSHRSWGRPWLSVKVKAEVREKRGKVP